MSAATSRRYNNHDQPLIVLVNPSGPAKTIPELVAMRRQSGQDQCGLARQRYPNHVLRVFKIMSGVDMSSRANIVARQPTS